MTDLFRLFLNNLLPLFGLQGVARQTAIVESAMPTAVITTVLSSEYNVEPAFVATTIFVPPCSAH